MKNKKVYLSAVAAFIALAVLIFDTKTAVNGAKDGVTQCMNTIVPSLFPFFIVSGYFCHTFCKINLSFLQPLCRLCKIPHGAESLFIMGILGGYPVGAKEIATAYRDKKISKPDAERMLAFCNNAGPSFIFGILASYFHSVYPAVCILIIQFLSAVITGIILPGGNGESLPIHHQSNNFSKILNNSIRSLTMVCSWVILFRIILSFLKKWVFWLFPDTVSIIITGMLELANGCVQLNQINNDGLRYTVSCGILSLGGMCVFMQTISVTKGLDMKMYFPGKLVQTLLSVIFASITQIFLFPHSQRIPCSYIFLSISAVLLIFILCFCLKNKKSVAIRKKLMYN